MDQAIRNKLRNVVTQCRKLLEDAISQELEGKYGIFARKDQVTADPNATMSHLTDEDQASRRDILDHFAHIKARGFKPKETLDQLVREIAFTHLNRLCAYKMMEAREVYVGGQKFREAVSRGVNSNGVKFYLAEHEDDERLFNTGQQDVAYRHFLDWLGGALSEEIGVLFNPNDPANRLYPRQKTLDEILDLLNGGGIKAEETELREQWPQIWAQDETIGWVYQYFTPKELRDQARKESSAPRNSYELAFRNQFFTPRYVVEFLTDNTLGRSWYEMRKGDTKLKGQCRYLVRRPTEIFEPQINTDEHRLNEEVEKKQDSSICVHPCSSVADSDLSQEELLKLPVHIPHRPKKDPRELKILDPACGSGHFLLYCFDLLLTIYEEAYADSGLGPALQKDYPKLENLQRDVPRLILAHNLHGIDIDLRASQIAALALWLRCQRAYQEMGLKKDRPKITRSNFVCAEPMPGEESMLKEFVGQLEPKVLGQVVEVVFDKMKLAGEAGSLLKIEEEIRDAVAEAKKQWVRETAQATDRKGQPLLFTQADWDQLDGKPEQQSLFDFSDLTDTLFFENAETRVIEALRSYAEKAQSGQKLQKRLFTEDAVRGFSFVDLCQNRYDVVLMNPPFGESISSLDAHLRLIYPNGFHDLLLCFVERALSLLNSHGICGQLTNRTGFYLSGAKAWRGNLLNETTLCEFADLGLDVLDTAMVQVAAYTFRIPRHETLPTWFARLLKVPHTDKEARLTQSIQSTCGKTPDSTVFYLHSAHFKSLPGQSLGYWLSPQLLNKLGDMQPTKAHGLEVRIGLQTSDDFRYLRNWWEVPSDAPEWIPFAKGGSYCPYFDDINLCVHWADNGASYWTPINPRIEKPYSNIWMLSETIARFFGSGGLTYPRRTSKKFNPRLLPVGAAFADKGPMIRWRNRREELALLALAYSRVFEWVMTAQVGKEGVDTRAAAISYEAGVILSTPIPTFGADVLESLAQLAEELVVTAAQPLQYDEVSHWFVAPFHSSYYTLAAIAEDYVRSSERCLLKRLELESHVENLVNQAYGLSGEDSAGLDDALLPMPTGYPKNPDHEVLSAFEIAYREGASSFYRDGEEDGEVSARGRFHADTLEAASQLFQVHPATLMRHRQSVAILRSADLTHAASSVMSWTVGVCFGRWDSHRPQLTFPKMTCGALFEEIPKTSPGVNEGGRNNQGNTILVDDPLHADNIVQRVQDVIATIWQKSAEAIESEFCQILGVTQITEYFRKPGKGGFWDDHISRYSKSRRKAPIYWLLQSSKKNYALWLYYHRLDKDLLFKALVNYVEPKIRLETSRLETLRSQKTATGDSGKEAKRFAKDAEKQEDFLSELRDFEDKLRRAANLHLEPDLNDGVVLNIAPLHELVPWKEAKNYWTELLAGKYEWSSISQQLRQKGLVK